jgi:hypothetical protein
MIEGGCNCGAVRYSIEGAPLAVVACHCTRCRRQSGSVYSVNLVVMASAVTVAGPLATYEDTQTSSGVPVSRQFCGTCGSPIRSIIGANPDIVAIKAGTADEPDALAPEMHIWTQSKIAWVEIPAGMPQFPQNAG